MTMNGSNENGNCNSLLKEPVLVYIFEAIISNVTYPDEDLLVFPQSLPMHKGHIRFKHLALNMHKYEYKWSRHSR
jgi:hypothetical protein